MSSSASAESASTKRKRLALEVERLERSPTTGAAELERVRKESQKYTEICAVGRGSDGQKVKRDEAPAACIICI